MNDFYHKNGDKTKKGLEKLISFDLPSLNTKHERKIQLFKKNSAEKCLSQVHIFYSLLLLNSHDSLSFLLVPMRINVLLYFFSQL